MKNPTLDVIVLRAVFGSVGAAVYAIVDFDVRRAVYEAVDDAVGRAVNWAVHGAVDGAVKEPVYQAVAEVGYRFVYPEAPPHPGLELYLGGVA